MKGLRFPIFLHKSYICPSETIENIIMPRPSTKADLVASSSQQFEKLLTLIKNMGIERQNANFPEAIALAGKEAHWGRDKNLRDVLIHLYEWHQLLSRWIKANRGGEHRPFLPEPYNWKTYSAMNVELWKKHQGTSLGEAKRLFSSSHQEIMSLINSFSDDELFSKGVFDWTGTTTLGSYCASATSSHYDWALKKLKKYIKLLEG